MNRCCAIFPSVVDTAEIWKQRLACYIKWNLYLYMFFFFTILFLFLLSRSSHLPLHGQHNQIGFLSCFTPTLMLYSIWIYTHKHKMMLSLSEKIGINIKIGITFWCGETYFHQTCHFYINFVHKLWRPAKCYNIDFILT